MSRNTLLQLHVLFWNSHFGGRIHRYQRCNTYVSSATVLPTLLGIRDDAVCSSRYVLRLSHTVQVSFGEKDQRHRDPPPMDVSGYRKTLSR